MSVSLVFIECDSCAVKPGSPYLCKACLSNRDQIFALHAENKILKNQNQNLRSYVQDMADAGGFVGAAAKGVLRDCDAIRR